MVHPPNQCISVLFATKNSVTSEPLGFYIGFSIFVRVPANVQPLRQLLTGAYSWPVHQYSTFTHLVQSAWLFKRIESVAPHVSDSDGADNESTVTTITA